MVHKEALPHVVIALARCARLKDLFGIRFEERQNGMWTGTWAFKTKEETAKKEGYDREMIKGSFTLENYPGCPYCGSHGFFICGRCGRVVCLSEETSEVTCSWCGNKGRLTVTEKLEFRTGKDR